MVAREASNVLESSASVGSLSPTRNLPEAIPPSIASSTCLWRPLRLSPFSPVAETRIGPDDSFSFLAIAQFQTPEMKATAPTAWQLLCDTYYYSKTAQ